MEHNYTNIRMQRSFCGIIDQMLIFITDQVKDEHVEVEKISTKETRRKAIVEAIKYLIDNGDFRKRGFDVTFNDDYSKFRKVWLD